MKRYEKFFEYEAGYNIIDNKTVKLLNEFLDLSKYLFDIRNKTVGEADLKYLQRYSKFLFVKESLDKINKALNDVDSDSKQNQINLILQKIQTSSKGVYQKLLQSDFKSLQSFNIENEFERLQKLLISNEQKINANIGNLKNITKSDFSFIFNAGNKTGLLASFNKDDWASLNETIIELPLFNYLRPPTYKDNFEYFVYFIQKNKTDDNSIELSEEAFRDYIQILFKRDSNFKKFEKYMDSYLHSNKKEFIPKLMDLLKLFPIIEKENEESKLKIKQVYRGLKFSERDDLYYDFLAHKKVDYQFAATSISKGTANNFASGANYLFSSDSNDSKEKIGLVLTYKVDPKDILINFNILKTVFMEGEILINTKTAELVNVEEI